MTERLDFEIQLRTEAAERAHAVIDQKLNATGKDMGKAMAASAKAGIAEAQAAAERASAAVRRGAAPTSAIPSAFGGVVQGARAARAGAADLSQLRAVPASAWAQASAERSAVPWMQPGARRAAAPTAETVKVNADTSPATGAWAHLKSLFGGGVEAPVRADTKGAESSLSGLRTLALGVGSAMAAISAGREILETGMAFQQVTTTLTAATGNSSLAAAEFDYVRDVSSRLGLSLRTTAEDYSRFAAATRGTAIEGKATHAVFEGMASASAVLGLRSDQVSLSLKALQQMVSKGKVSSEELNQQLGDHLPGALQIAARAMGVTTAQLGKMMKDGKLQADQFLPRFAEQLQREFGPGAAAAANSLRANLARAGNAWDELKLRVFGGGFEQALSGQMQRLSALLSSPEAMAAATSLGEGIGSAISMAGSAFGFVIEHAEEFKAALVGLGAVGAAATLGSIATSAMGLAAALGPVGIAAAAVVGGLYYFRDAAIDVGGEQVALKDLLLGTWDAISAGVAASSDEVVGWVRTKWGAVQGYFAEMGVNLTGFAAGAISAWTATMKGIWDVVRATISDIGGAFASLGSAVKLSLSGSFSEAGQTLARGFGGTATFTAAEQAGANIAAAYRRGFEGGDIAGSARAAVSDAARALDGATGGAISGAGAEIGARARQRAAERREQERQDAEARVQREAQAKADRERRDREHGEWLNRPRPGSPANDDGKGGGHGDTAARQLEALRARNAELQGLNGAYQQGEKAVTAITAAYEAEKAVLALGTKATAAQKDEARRLAIANRELEDANKKLLEAMRKVEESKKKADNLVSSYGIERQELEALSAVYRSGTGDIEQRVAQLAREKELREKIRDLTADDAARVRAEAARTADQAAQTERDKKSFEDMKKYYDGIGEAGASAFASVLDGSRKASDGIKDFGKALSQLALKQFVMAPFQNMLSSLASGLGNSLGLGSVNSAVGNGQQGGGVLGSALAGAGKWIGNGIASLFGGGSALTPAVAGARAGGGPVVGGQNYRVNEMGGRPEWFVAPLDGRVLTDAQMQGAAGGGSGGARSAGGRPVSIVMNISTPNPQAFRESQGQLMARTRDMVSGGARYR